MQYKQSMLILSLILLPLSQQVLAATPGERLEPLDRPAAKMLPESESVLKSPTLPELPPVPQNEEQLSSMAYIEVSEFQFEGNSIFSDAELTEMAQNYQGKKITAEQLQRFKNEITTHYVKNGYINSGAVIPDQQITNGIVKIQIIEGKLSKIEVSGNEHLRASYIQKRLQDNQNAILDIEKLQQRLQILQQDQRLGRINAELGPGVKLGEGILKLNVKEAPFYDAIFTFNNHRSPSVGSYRGQVEFNHRNVTGLFGKGFGDSFYFRYGLTEGLNDVSLRYEFPLNHNTWLSFNAERSDAEVVEYPFSMLNIESESKTFAATLRHSLAKFKEPGQSLDLSLRIEKRTSQTFLGPETPTGFSFSPGVGDDGKSKLSVMRLSQDWIKRSSYDVFAARSSFNFGLDAFDSTVNDNDLPDSKFFTWLGQFQYVRRLNFEALKFDKLKKSQIIFRTDVQWAKEDLLPLEKLSIGGATTVRGYRENLLTRDNGLISSLEWRIPVFKLPIKGISKTPEDGEIYVAPFVDYGRSWNTDIDTPDPKSISSAGLGLRWSPSRAINAQVYWGHALRDIQEPDDKNLQDDGIHFELSLRVPF
ncbi:ShlB/FhaC/HecB family hemolysin secretion/activation protein [Candidatus Halobeggiatoa sp. HSG11]|nr:ShlB/FhaC/HecB family hemolysin secretion/activation protein [Candidatus Halobeggiatoa sp. HSG11]